jgi:hypothetical protein
MNKLYAVATSVCIALLIVSIVGAVYLYRAIPANLDGTVAQKFYTTGNFGKVTFHFVVNASNDMYLVDVTYSEYLETSIGEAWWAEPWEKIFFILGMAIAIMFAILFGIFTVIGVACTIE